MLFNWRRVKSGLQWSWSLEDSSLQNILWHFTALLKVIGINMNGEMTNQGIHLMGFVFATLVFMIVEIGMWTAIVSWNDHRRIDTETAYIAILSIRVNAGWLFYKRHDIMELLNMVLKQNESLTQIEEIVLRKEMMSIKSRCRAFCIAQAIIIVVYQYAGIVAGKTSTPSFPILLPGMGDETKFPNVVIYEVIRQMSLTYMALIMLAYWFLFVATVGHACGHAKAIAAEVSSIKTSDRDITARVCYVVKRHQQFKAFVSGMNSIITVSIGVELTIYFIGACVNFQEPCKITILYVGFMLAISLLYCYFGEYLVASADTIAIAVYGTEWHKMKPRDAKMLLLMLMNSQEPQKLMTLKVFELSNAAYMDLVKMLYSAFSFIAVLKE